MKKIMILGLFVFISLFMTASGGEGYGQILGYYAPDFDYIYAVNEAVCMHEVAHKMDYEAGWVSKTSEWRWAVNKSMKENMDTESIDRTILFYIHDLTELYADIYKECYAHDFCIPEQLRPFYNFEYGDQLIRERCVYGLDHQ